MMNNGFSILSGPFVFDANHEPELLSVVTGNASIVKHDGIHFINSELLSPDGETGVELDNNFMNLIESVMEPLSH